MQISPSVAKAHVYLCVLYVRVVRFQFCVYVCVAKILKKKIIYVE